MDSQRSNEQDALIFGVRNSSLISILERGLHYLQQERYAEGIVLLSQAHEQLSPDQVSLSAALDAFIQGHTLYWQAQQALHHASQRFTEAVTSQQMHLGTLHNLLATLVEEKEIATQPHSEPASQSPRDPQLYQAQEPAADDQFLPALYIYLLWAF